MLPRAGWRGSEELLLNRHSVSVFQDETSSRNSGDSCRTIGM